MPTSSPLSFRDRLLAWAVSCLGWAVVQFIGKTSRFPTHSHPQAPALLDHKKPVTYAFWHRFQLLLVYERRDLGIHVLVSQSRDGEFIARTLHRFGFRTVRGSSSRGGRAALMALLDTVRAGGQTGITPDGPRGPFRSVQPGVVAVARKTGTPILPLAWAGSRVKELSSWDRFLIPKPFGRYEVVLGEPFTLGAEDGAEEKVQRALDGVHARAEALLAAAHDPAAAV